MREKMRNRLFMGLILANALAISGCMAWQSCHVDAIGGATVEGFNGVIGNPGLPLGNYKVYWEAGSWHYDGAGIARHN